MTDAPLTRRDSPAPPAGPATTRDVPASPPTTRDGARIPDQPAPPTVRDGGSTEGTPFVRVNLPSALQGRYRPLHDLPHAGAEADLVVAEAADGSGTWIVKVYRPGIELDGALLDTIATAGGDHVVGSREHGRSDGTWYEVLEHVHGGSLADLLRATPGGLPVPRVREILVELHSALTAFHALGVVHRDLKPGNVLVRSPHPLDLVLADFGLATVVERSWRLASASRTLAYAAPESAHGHVSPARDWWSLGLIVLEALTGEQPLVGLDDAVVSIHLATRSIDVGAVQDDVWRRLCRGLLTRDPALRWGSEQVAEWLEGGSPEVATESDTVLSSGARPYVFDGQSCATPRELAVAMARSWKAAGRQLVADGHAYRSLTGWLLEQTNSGDLAARIDDLAGVSSPDKRVAALVYAIAPDLNPVFRGFDLAGDGLAALARAARGNPGGPEGEAVKVLLDQDVLPLYPSLTDVAARWKELHGAVSQRIQAADGAGAARRLDGTASTLVAAYALQLTVDPAAEAELDAQHRALPEGAETRAWYRSLGTDTAGKLARTLLAAAADGQRLDDERAAARRAAEAQRQAEEAAEEARRARAAQAVSRLRRSTGSLRRLLPFTAAVGATGLLLPGWLETGSSAVPYADAVFAGVFSDPAVVRQLVANTGAVRLLGLLLTAVTLAGVGVLLAARRAPSPQVLRAMRVVTVSGASLLPVLWWYAVPRSLGTAREDARTVGRASERDQSLRRWALAGTIPVLTLAVLKVVLPHTTTTGQPFALEQELVSQAPESLATWYFASWPPALSLTGLVDSAPGLLVPLLIVAAVATYVLVLRSHQVRHVAERRALQAAVSVGAAACLPLLPFLLLVVFYIVVVVLFLAIAAWLFTMLGG